MKKSNTKLKICQRFTSIYIEIPTYSIMFIIILSPAFAHLFTKQLNRITARGITPLIIIVCQKLFKTGCITGLASAKYPLASKASVHIQSVILRKIQKKTYFCIKGEFLSFWVSLLFQPLCLLPLTLKNHLTTIICCEVVKYYDFFHADGAKRSKSG